jgi:hypothetical protein
MHAHDCSCPPIEEWDADPYSEDPPVPADPAYTTVQYRMTSAHARALKRLAAVARKAGTTIDPDSPLAILEWAATVTAIQFGVILPPRAARHGGPRTPRA